MVTGYNPLQIEEMQLRLRTVVCRIRRDQESVPFVAGTMVFILPLL